MVIQTSTVVASASLSDLRELAAAGQLYAILDACDAPAVPAKADELGEERAISLYRGDADEMYWAIAPYLVRVDKGVFEWIVETLWQEPWGIFVISSSDIEALRKHFRKFLMVEGPAGEEWYFRFYDPRVLASFLPTCDDVQLGELFGPVEAYGIPSAPRETIGLFRDGRAAPECHRRAQDGRDPCV